MRIPSREEVIRLLVEAGVSGPHPSHARADNERAAQLVAEDRGAVFGLSNLEPMAADQVLAAAAQLTGAGTPGEEFIDPEATLAGVGAAAARLREAAGAGARVLLGTGHPTGMISLLMQLALRLEAAGARVLRPLDDERLGGDGERRRIRYVGGVAVLTDGANLLHTHAPWAMQQMLAETPRPDLVVADHGFAGAAINAGIPTITTMDSNDLALAAAWAAGCEVIVIPLDDNRRPDAYLPLVPLLAP